MLVANGERTIFSQKVISNNLDFYKLPFFLEKFKEGTPSPQFSSPLLMIAFFVVRQPSGTFVRQHFQVFLLPANCPAHSSGKTFGFKWQSTDSLPAHLYYTRFFSFCQPFCRIFFKAEKENVLYVAQIIFINKDSAEAKPFLFLFSVGFTRFYNSHLTVGSTRF